MEKLNISKKVVEENLIRRPKTIINPFETTTSPKKTYDNVIDDKDAENIETAERDEDNIEENIYENIDDNQSDASMQELPPDIPASPIFYEYDGKTYTVDNSNFLQRNFTNVEPDMNYKMNLCIYKCVLKGCMPYLLYLMVYDENTDTLIFPHYTIRQGSSEEAVEDTEIRILNEFKESLFEIYPPGIILNNQGSSESSETSEKYDIYTEEFFRGFFVHDEKDSSIPDNGMITMVYDATRVIVPLSGDKQYYWVTPYEMFALKQMNQMKVNADIIRTISTSYSGSLDKSFYHLKDVRTNELIKDPYVLFLSTPAGDSIATSIGFSTFENVVFNETPENTVQIIYPRTNDPTLGIYTFFSSQTTIKNGKRFAVFVDINDLQPLYVEPEEADILNHLYDVDQESSYSAITYMNGSQQLWCIKSPLYFSEIEETYYKELFSSNELKETDNNLMETTNDVI